MNKFLTALFITATVMSSSFITSTNASSTLTPGPGATEHSDPNDSGYWHINSNTGKKTWTSGKESQVQVNSALCGNAFLRLMNNCRLAP